MSRSQKPTGPASPEILKTPPTTLACDIDGVVYPYLEKIYHILGLDYRAEQHDSYGINTHIDLAPGRVVEAQKQLFLDQTNHWIEPYPGAATTIRQLADRGVRIVFLTRRAHYLAQIGGNFDQAVKLTRQWLLDWAPEHQLDFVNRKTDYQDHYDLILDDNPDEVEALIRAGRTAFLFNQPYNSQSDLPRYNWPTADNPNPAIDLATQLELNNQPYQQK